MNEEIRGNRIDVIRPDAPDLAPFGPLPVGVKTITFTNPGQVDVARTETGKPAPLYDRPLKAEIWYPAKQESDRPSFCEYENVMTRDGKTLVSLWGQAVRNADPAKEAAPCPLVILSHGYPGNRFIMSHFGENLASKGYIVVSMDHFESTYDNLGAFSSTLYNRPLDQLFILNAMARLNDEDEDEGMGMGMGMGANLANLAGMIDADRTAIVGYSMGGYGLINTIGGGFCPAIVKAPLAPPNMLLAARQAGNPQYEASLDSRIKAAVAIAPWGWTHGFWDKAGLKGVKTPLLFLAGSIDTTVGYELGVRNIFENCVHAERYLLTFENAGHNAIAPIPAPREVCLSPGPDARYWKHYQDPVWDGVRGNNIAQHFVTAFLAKYLMKDPTADAYLDLPERSKESTAGSETSWKGFNVRNASGLRFEYRGPTGIQLHEKGAVMSAIGKNVDRIRFAHLPTPIEEMKRLSAELGGPRLFVKRDDATGLALGGNKTRKLEFLVADALAKGARTLVTAGAAQSNHCRQTAAAAAKFGLGCVLVLNGTEPDEPSANLLLDKLFGARIIWLADRKDRERTQREACEKLDAAGEKSYFVPYGGSSPMGVMGYTFAVEEALAQGIDTDWFVFGTSSGGTHAGLALGARLFGYRGKVLGISIDESEAWLKARVSALASDASELLGGRIEITPEEILANDSYCSAGYGVLTGAEREAVKLFARAEGLLLDPVYTGRAAAGLVDLIRKGCFRKDESVLFWNTGGQPALFAEKYQDILGET